MFASETSNYGPCDANLKFNSGTEYKEKQKQNQGLKKKGFRFAFMNIMISRKKDK